jgi:hypothetical protein
MRRRLLATSAAMLIAGLAATLPAAAGLFHATVVSSNPADHTPHVLDGEVRAFAVVGTTVVVGGDFTRVTDSTRRATYRRTNLFAYEQTTGRLLDFAPKVDGPVLTLATATDGTVYAGGAFQRVNDQPQRGLARLRLDTGARVPTFAASANWGDVRSLITHGPWLYAAGTFSRIGTVERAGLVRLVAATGAVDASFDLRLRAPNLTRVKVDDLALSPDGTKLVAIGAIEQAGGNYRAQLAMIDTVGAKIADWYTDAYAKGCRAGFETYLRGVDFSPDGSYFAVVTTGRKTGPGLMCDTVARFETAGTGLHRPTWVNFTGGDSLYSVSVTGSAVYVGGHQRWMDNQFGRESRGPGAVARKGIAAVHPVTGKALAWAPDRPRGIGARALLATPFGLLVGSDTDFLGNEYHARLGLFPF